MACSTGMSTCARPARSTVPSRCPLRAWDREGQCRLRPRRAHHPGRPRLPAAHQPASPRRELRLHRRAPQLGRRQWRGRAERLRAAVAPRARRVGRRQHPHPSRQRAFHLVCRPARQFMPSACGPWTTTVSPSPGPPVTPPKPAPPCPRPVMPDTSEEDDTPANPPALPLNTVAQRNLCGAGDPDWFKVTLPDTKEYFIGAPSLNGGAAVKLTVYAANGVTVLSTRSSRRRGPNRRPGLPPSRSRHILHPRRAAAPQPDGHASHLQPVCDRSAQAPLARDSKVASQWRFVHLKFSRHGDSQTILPFSGVWGRGSRFATASTPKK